MRVFVYEYLSSGAAGETSAIASLQTEGWAMLLAVLEDFGRCRGVETTTLLDPRLARLTDTWPPCIVPNFLRAAPEEDAFRALAASADFSLIIAPEFDDILLRRCRWVEEEGGRLLGPSSAAVHLTADKRILARHWRAHGVPTPYLVDPLEAFDPIAVPSPTVWKPRFGAGSQATFLMRDGDYFLHLDDRRRVEGWSGEMILQAYVPGLAVSVAFLAGAGSLLSLPAVKQHLSTDGRFRYLGGRVPLPDPLDRRARSLAERAARCVEGLQGWFGVDLVLGDAADGSGDAVIEINPRLTTSYVGLRRLAHFNLAEALLAVAIGSRPPCRDWSTGPIAFRANGEIVG